MNDEVKKELVELFKAEGLELAEETVELAVKAVFKVLPIIAKKTTNPLDDMLVGSLAPILERELLKLVDKIDGKQGE